MSRECVVSRYAFSLSLSLFSPLLSLSSPSSLPLSLLLPGPPRNTLLSFLFHAFFLLSSFPSLLFLSSLSFLSPFFSLRHAEETCHFFFARPPARLPSFFCRLPSPFAVVRLFLLAASECWYAQKIPAYAGGAVTGRYTQVVGSGTGVAPGITMLHAMQCGATVQRCGM